MTPATALSPELTAKIIRKASPKKRRIKTDPVLGPTTGLVSTLSSAAKRDGSVLHLAIVEAIRANPNITIMSNERIPITASAKRLADGEDYATCLGSDLEFAGAIIRYINVDIIVIDRTNRTATAYELKRGGMCDSEKRQKIIDKLILVKLILAKYLKSRGHDVYTAEIGLIVYYGSWSLKPIPTISRQTIDKHFGVPVTPTVALAADLMRQGTMGALLPTLEATLESMEVDLNAPEKAEERRALTDLLARILKKLRGTDDPS